MIYLLHGDDKTAAYARLEQIIKTDSSKKRLSFSKENSRDDLYMALFGQSLLEEENVIVATNFIKDKKIDAKDDIFKNIPKESVLVLWEQGEITPTQVKNFAPLSHIEVFKPQSVIFQFLDSLSPNNKNALSILHDLELQDPCPIIWHISSRIFLLILAKLGLDIAEAGKINGRNLAPWQWEKIKNQAKLFDLETLKSFLSGCLKSDLLIKTGKTDLDEMALTSFLILKYLKK